MDNYKEMLIAEGTEWIHEKLKKKYDLEDKWMMVASIEDLLRMVDWDEKEYPSIADRLLYIADTFCEETELKPDYEKFKTWPELILAFVQHEKGLRWDPERKVWKWIF